MSAELPVALIMAKGLTVRGVVEGDSEPHTFIPRLVQLYASGELPLAKLVTTYAFDDFPRAWAAAKAGGVIKPVLVTERQDPDHSKGNAACRLELTGGHCAILERPAEVNRELRRSAVSVQAGECRRGST